MMEDEETTFISSMGDEAIAITSSCVKGYLDIKKWNSSIKYELNCQWDGANIDNRYSVCILVEYLPKK